MSKKEPGHKERTRYLQGLPVSNANAAGIDIGDSKHGVAIRGKDSSFITREYESFTDGLDSLVEWLVSEGVTTVAMESTGGY